VVETPDDTVSCIAGCPPGPLGRDWPSGSTDDAAEPASSEGSSAWWKPPHDLISPTMSTLCLPFALRGRRGAIVLTRRQGEPTFGASEVASGRGLAILAAVALAAHETAEVEARCHALRGVVRHVRERQHEAQRNSDLLDEIVDLLPIGVSVQRQDGRFILANRAAAANLGLQAATLVGAAPADVLPADQAAKRSRSQAKAIATGALVTGEEKAGPAGDRTLLTSHKSVRVLDDTLLLSSSLDITDRKQIEGELARRAYFDELTGLAKGSLLRERVEDLLERSGDADRRFALAFIDLDNFKHINDYYSHAIGDALLIKVAARIGGRIRETDMLARISGDEFVLLIDPVENSEQLRGTVERLLEVLKQPFHIEGFEVFTSASIGMSLYPEHGRSYEALRRNADSAMSRAKSGGKGSAALFDRNMGKAITARMELEQRLRLAIRDRQLRCAFQPKVDIRTQSVVGFEALIRWCDDRGSIQAPSEFIGLAIELGLIDPITQFVTAEAVAALAELDDAFGNDTTMSINVAAKQAGDQKFMRSLAETLADSGCARRFMLELTEDAFVAKSLFQTQVLPILREAGVRVSIDDFGTGYSSLSALADITADEIKVDRSFVTDIHQRPRSQSILKTIESLSDALGMTAIAEGVESFEELAYLQAATRIRYAQGYYFSRPFFLEDFSKGRRVASDARTTSMSRDRAETRGFRSTRANDNART